MQDNKGHQIGKKCNNILGIYDPFHARNNSTTNAEYRMICNSSSPQRCELGDLSGKLGQINIIGKLMMYSLLSTFPISPLTALLHFSLSHIKGALSRLSSSIFQEVI